MLKREISQYQLQYKLLNEKLDRVSSVLKDLQDRDDNIYRVIFEAEPIPATIRKASYGGADRYSKLKGYENSELIVQTTMKVDQIISQLYVQSKSFDYVFELAKNKSEMMARIPAIQPLNKRDMRALSSSFGYRPDPIYKVTKFHPGIDFSAPTGTKVYATGDGIVKDVIRNNGGYGNTLIIDHGYSYSTVYAHLYKFAVSKGSKVKRGQHIANVGNTGKSTAPHLHYEVRKYNRPINPIYFFFNDITPEQYNELLEISKKSTQSMD